MTAAGVDLSLTSTGIAVVTPSRTVLERVTSSGRKDATLDQRQERLAVLTRRIVVSIPLTADLVAIEGPSFGQSRQSGEHDRAGLWWLVVSAMRRQGVRVVEIPPATVKTYATGKGNAPKDHVLAAVVRRYPDVDVAGNDQADALVLAAMAARHLGSPIDDMPKDHLRAMDKVAWPQLVTP